MNITIITIMQPVPKRQHNSVRTKNHIQTTSIFYKNTN
jgi:hypothetical protein